VPEDSQRLKTSHEHQGDTSVKSNSLHGVGLSVLFLGLLAQVSLMAQANGPSTEPKAPAPSQIEEPAKKRASPIEVLTDTMGVDFNPYLNPVLQSVRQH
jgi:hypothetical protein